MEAMAETKCLDYNLDKSCFLVAGGKKVIKSIENDLSVNPLTFCGQNMKRVLQNKYLGDELCPSLSESVTATVNKRKGVALQSIHDICTIVEDCRAGVIGGFSVALDL